MQTSMLKTNQNRNAVVKTGECTIEYRVKNNFRRQERAAQIPRFLHFLGTLQEVLTRQVSRFILSHFSLITERGIYRT